MQSATSARLLSALWSCSVEPTGERGRDDSNESNEACPPTGPCVAPVSIPDVPQPEIERSDGTRLPSIKELRTLLGTEFAGFGSRAVRVGLLGGVVALVELAIVLAIASLGAAILRGKADEPVALVAGITISTTQLAVLTVLAVVARGIVEVGYVIVQTRSVTNYEIQARSSLLGAYTDAEWTEQTAQPPPQIVNTAYSFLATSRNTYRQTMDIVTSMVSFLLMIGGSFVAGGPWALGIIGGAALITLCLRPLARRSHGAGAEARDAAHKFGDAIWETVLLARETRVLGISGLADRKNRLEARKVADANKDRDLLAGLSASAYSSALFGVVTSGLLILTVTDIGNPARMAAILLLLFRGLGYGRTFQTTYQSVMSNEPAIRSLRETRERLEAARLPQGGLPLEGQLRRLQFRDVGFRYPGGQSALSNVTLTLEHGDALGVVGPSGAGKSTFVHLMLRLLQPTHGEILVNDLGLSEVDLSTWFGRAVLLPQDARTYEGSVLDNVTCGRPQIGEEQAREALRSAHLLEEMETLPNGLDTVVTGDRLSGGQRQRLAIARALAGRPEILVLDEPTSALDLVSEEGIRRTLEALRGQITLVIVAHRLSTLRICDRVAVFEHGRLEAVGSREELENNSGFYAEALRLARLV